MVTMMRTSLSLRRACGFAIEHVSQRTTAGCRFAASSAAPAVTSKAKGDALELRVARILKAEGRWRVRHNLTVVDGHGNRSQIDVAYGLLRPYFVECKAYAPDNKVGLEDVAKFKEVLRLNGLPPSRGLFVTTSSFSPRALTTGIRTIDGEQLRAWEKRSRAARRWRLLRSGLLVPVLLSAVAAIGVAPA